MAGEPVVRREKALAVNIAPNPPHGERGDFRKITFTLPPDAYEKLVRESARRKIAGEPNHLLSSLIREAVIEYLRRDR